LCFEALLQERELGNMLMKLSKRFNLGIKLSITALFLIGLTVFGFMRSDRLGAVAASPQSTKANVAASTCGSWSVVASPNFVTKPNYLFSVAAISASDIWAVGKYGNSIPRTLIEHWNGSKWSITPRPAIANSSLNGVAALASNDVWAVGDVLNGSYHTLIEHWNGSIWSVVPSPNTQAEDYLQGIAVVSPNDIWATGETEDSIAGSHTLFEHWNGTQWSIIASPDPGGTSRFLYLLSIAAVSSNNVWAVGSYDYGQLIEHWDGMQWSIIASPNVGTISNGLRGVSVVSANNIWAVGSYGAQSVDQTLVEHWNGTQWSVVSSPNTGPVNQLTAITAISATNIWAVGYNTDGSNPSFPPYYTLIEHWDGIQWSVISSPNPGTFRNILYGETHVPGTSNVWSVGEFEGPGVQTLTEHYC
jgi:hypothetical protein